MYVTLESDRATFHLYKSVKVLNSRAVRARLSPKHPTFALALQNKREAFGKGGYQSGQMGQTVNLLALPSVVRIHHHPPNITINVNIPVSVPTRQTRRDIMFFAPACCEGFTVVPGMSPVAGLSVGVDILLAVAVNHYLAVVAVFAQIAEHPFRTNQLEGALSLVFFSKVRRGYLRDLFKELIEIRRVFEP